MILVFVSAFLGAFAQVALRFGALAAGATGLPLLKQGLALLSSPGIWIGLGLYALSGAIWILALSEVPVSRAYPVVSIGYVLTTIAGRLFFAEPVSVSQALGVCTILAGVFLVARV